MPLVVFSQNQDPAKVDKPILKALSVVQIPDFGQQTRNLINEVQQKINDTISFKKISYGVNEVSSILDIKYKDVSDSLAPLKLDRLSKEVRELSLLTQRINQWKNKIQDFHHYGIRYDSLTYNKLKIWQLTLDSIGQVNKTAVEQKKVPVNSNDLISDLNIYVVDLQLTRKSLDRFKDSIQRVQTEITIAENKLGTISSLIASNKEQLQQSIWKSEMPAIWNLKKDTLQSNKLKRVVDYAESNSSIINSYIKTNPELPMYFLAFIVLVFSISFYLRSKVKELYARFHGEFEDALVVLKLPFLTALVITWFATVFISSFPKEVHDLWSLVMLLPLVVILSKLNSHWRWYTLVLFACTYLLFLFIKEIDYSYLPQRILLTILDGLALTLFIHYKRHKDRFKEVIRIWYAILPLVLDLFILISGISLIASIVGSIQLAKLLSHLILGVIITIHALSAAIRLIRNFTFLILLGPMMKYSNILKTDSELVLHKIDKLFRFLGFATLVYVIINLLNIKQASYEVIMNIINFQLTIGEITVSLSNILAFFITIQMAVWISSLTRYVLEKEVFPRSTFKQGIPNTILLMIKFTFVLFGILFAFSAAGIQIDKLAIAMGALGVGIGFGLQNIISNFISGIILALERPITIGDLIEIPEVSGVVKDIGIRASTVRTWDGSDVIVPNAELISNKLTNWTFYDRLRRVKVEIRVPFDTDIENVSILLLKAANAIPEVMKKPKAYLNFKGIGTSYMEITVYCWIDDADKIFSCGTAIRKGIYKSLSEAGYDMPLPKQELKVTSDETSK